MTKRIVSVSLGPVSRDFEFATDVFGQDVRVQRFGVGGDLQRAKELVSQFDGQVDAIALSGMNVYFRTGHRTYIHDQIRRVADAAHSTPVVDGLYLKNTLDRWAIGRIAEQFKGTFNHKRVFVLFDIDRYAVAQVLSSYTNDILFGDAIFHFNLPFALRSFKQLNFYARLVLPRACRAHYGRLCPAMFEQEAHTPHGTRYFHQADIIVGDYVYLKHMAPRNLQGKTIITGSLSAHDVENLRQRGVESLITATPPLDAHHPFVDASVLQAIMISFMEKPWRDVTGDDYLNMVAHSDLEPCLRTLNEPRAVDRFAFVIHPLGVNHFFNHPQLKYLRILPKRPIERLLANMRPMYLSRISGIRSSATGVEIEGFLLGLGATPRELMRRKPGFTYRRLIVASRMAQQKGAKIMGLGAFTKVVGDAGMTVAYKSDIAITSGNSLTVVATLEAAKQAVAQMGGPIDQGRAVVIGATGSIGSVCSRLIAQAIRDVVLVAPRPEKLIALQRTIERETPGAQIKIATDAAAHLSDADLVITTTTAIGQKVIDVLQLKPGCVICDVARPPDVQEHDAKLRPDVLVIESGEILLPGEPVFGFDIGLPPGVAYACLAEAAVLAMEGRYENFTLGRNIEMDKVKEMYHLFGKHGLQLEGLRSFGRYVTNDDISEKRDLADKLRQRPSMLADMISQAKAVQAAERVEAPDGKWAGAWIAAGVGSALIALTWLLSRQRRSGR